MNDKQNIFNKIDEAIQLRPLELEPDLADLTDYPGVPNWHDYESKIWEIGEDIRQIHLSNNKLRRDTEINSWIADFCLDNRSKRGRQSFLSCLENVHAKGQAEKVALLVKDPYVDGQAISCLLKMRVPGYGNLIAFHLGNDTTWIKNLAKKYIERYGV
ncbi:hypothetical protein [Aureitalea marina]|uniref:Uncharacterized protein n=1 Tax=Aureitalea marina TaxID=930804 RepID=A0A2S7KP47_9FLAO|nr:hypothetical protein [Aureitalea marina]PQB04343.1 hypothetical protein BST85_05090 [Aureitalea marina]